MKFRILLALSLLLLMASASAVVAESPTQEIRQKLSERADLGEYDIGLNTRRGIVTLVGLVESERVRQEIVDTAKSTARVIRIEDRLQVSPAQLEELDTSPKYREILTSVERKVNAHPSLTDHLVYLSLDNNNTTARLTGYVQDETDRELVEQLVLSEGAISRVDNQLTIWTPRDEVLQARVSDILDLTEGVNRDAIEISVRDGEVTLSGNLPTFRAVDRTLANTLMVDGVKKIDSRLTVNGKPYRQAWEAAKRG